jgi:hypothetical protein
VSYSGADPDLLAAYAVQSLDAADSLRLVGNRLHDLEHTLPRAVPRPPPVGDLVDRFARLERRTRELGERVGVFGTRLRVALGGPGGPGGPGSGVPLAMQGLLFRHQVDSPPRPKGWEAWSAKDRTAYLKALDPVIRSIHTVDPWDVDRLAGVAGRSFVNGVVGSADGITNAVTFGFAPDIGPAYRTGDWSRPRSCRSRHPLPGRAPRRPVRTPRGTFISGAGLRSSDAGQTWQPIEKFPNLKEQGWRHELVCLANGWLLASEIPGAT